MISILPFKVLCCKSWDQVLLFGTPLPQSLPLNFSCPLCHMSLWYQYFPPVSWWLVEYLLALLWDCSLKAEFLSVLRYLQCLFYNKNLNKYLLNEIQSNELLKKFTFLRYMSVLWDIRFINTCFIYVLSLFCPSQPNVLKESILPRFIVSFSGLFCGLTLNDQWNYLT